jgi:hypothetical protein
MWCRGLAPSGQWSNSMRNLGGVENSENQDATSRMARLHRSGGASSRCRMTGDGRSGSNVTRAPSGRVMVEDALRTCAHQSPAGEVGLCIDGGTGSREVGGVRVRGADGDGRVGAPCALGRGVLGSSCAYLDVERAPKMDQSTREIPRRPKTAGMGTPVLLCSSTKSKATGVCRSM